MLKTWISAGDFIDLYYKVKQKGVDVIISMLHLLPQARTASKWNTVTASSNFWILPQIRTRWNELCTGSREMEYEEYIVLKYLDGKRGLRMLSVGCGTGSRERKFARHQVFSLIEGIDLAENQVNKAALLASEERLGTIHYMVGDFLKHEFKQAPYDLILFNSSLHHFNHIDKLLQNRVLHLLKDDGLLVVFEYVGPNRLQWTKEQLEFTNRLLKELPDSYRIRENSSSVKKRVYRPGLIRMLITDPSEAVDSESIIPSLHRHFEVVEEKKLGWDITHLLLKDIAHHFNDDTPQTRELLQYVLEREDEYMALTGRSDGIFGVYRKR